MKKGIDVIYYMLCCLTVALFFSCKDEFEPVHVFYDEQGNLVKKIEYVDEMDTSNNVVYKYKDGFISKIYHSKDGRLNGSFIEFYEKGGVHRDLHMKSDMFYGVQYIYNEDGKHLDISLFIDDKQLAFSTQILNGKYTFPGSVKATPIDYSNYKPWNRQQRIPDSEYFVHFGGIVFDNKTNQIEEDYSNSWYIFGSDTIDSGLDTTFTVKLYGRNEFEFHLGEIDSAQNFISLNDVKTYKTVNGEIDFGFVPKKKGVNFIVGKIYTDESPVVLSGDTLPYIVYHKVYVK